jgi:2-dehydro-3-deoxyphosphogluconate aldolase/(4S)-4-hydroxy-2-oxoglutarate aldolase
MFPQELTLRVGKMGVVAVIIIEDPADAVPLARGISAIELTLRTPRALESIKRIRAELPDVLIGAGTVLTAAQLKDVKDAGAFFAVSPGCNPSTLRAAQDLGLPFAPGIANPSDIEIALEHGCRLLKFFPAGTSGGLPHLAAMGAAFAHLGVKYIPLGGITLETLGDYLKSPLVAAVGGSWLAKPEVIKAKNWAAITAAAAAATQVVQAVRG